MVNIKSLVLILTNVVLAALLAGCMLKSQPTRFYTLTATSEKQGLAEENNASDRPTIGIGPIKLADYLTQSRIVTRLDGNTINKAEFDQWSGAFKNNIINVLADNIGNLLNTEKIVIHPWRSFISIDYQVVVEIIRFDGETGKKANLEARWIVLRDTDKSIVDINRSSVVETVDAPGFAGLVAAQSRALGMLSTEIAQAISAASLR